MIRLVLNNLVGFVLNRLESAEGINNPHGGLKEGNSGRGHHVITLITLLGEYKQSLLLLPLNFTCIFNN